jgi:hypothetical protein
VVRKDPDITFPNLFLLGDHLTRKWAKAKKGMQTPTTSSLHHMPCACSSLDFFCFLLLLLIVSLLLIVTMVQE